MLITNPFCDEVNPALGAPLASLPLLKVNCPSLLSHHTVQTVGGGMDTNLWIKIFFKDFWKPLTSKRIGVVKVCLPNPTSQRNWQPSILTKFIR